MMSRHSPPQLLSRLCWLLYCVLIFQLCNITPALAQQSQFSTTFRGHLDTALSGVNVDTWLRRDSGTKNDRASSVQIDTRPRRDSGTELDKASSDAKAILHLRAGAADEEVDPYSLLTDNDKKAAFEASHNRGQALLCKLLDPASQEQSAFTKLSDLISWGWVKVPLSLPMTSSVFAEVFPLRDFYRDKQLDQRVPPNEIVNFEHQRTTTRDEGGRKVEYLATGAHYRTIVNPRDGLIIAYDLAGPQFAIDGAESNSPLKQNQAPKLKQYSDVVFLAWLSKTTVEQRAKLRYFMHYSVLNTGTTATIELALKSVGSRLTDHHGRTFSRSNVEEEQAAFEALVGSPNAQGVAWLLLQHAEALGGRSIKSITVWQYYSGEEDGVADGVTANMLVELAPAEELR